MHSRRFRLRILPGSPRSGPQVRPTGPLLLFIHGAFASHEPFANWMQTLGRDGWRCVAAGRRNQLGHGPAGVTDVTIDDYVADTLRVSTPSMRSRSSSVTASAV